MFKELRKTQRKKEENITYKKKTEKMQKERGSC